MTDRNTQTSKFLSYVLRHEPGSIGLSLDPGGWAGVDELLTLAGASGRPIGLDHLREVVTTNSKRRFAFSTDGRKIRAVQGHSIEVDLSLEPVQPPDILFHGTARRFLDSILELGLIKQQRQYVHLSADIETATSVGKRHGSPVVLLVAAAVMSREGHDLYLSQNGVWLVDHVPPTYLSLESR